MDEEADLQSRFAHLLKPIRDLTKNWNVNVATLLEDYLSEVRWATLLNRMLSIIGRDCTFGVRMDACILHTTPSPTFFSHNCFTRALLGLHLFRNQFIHNYWWPYIYTAFSCYLREAPLVHCAKILYYPSSLPPQLEQITISFDDGKTALNFTEAALLIQGSACVYSRKVEYLYALVTQTLDCISTKKWAFLVTNGPLFAWVWTL